MSLPRIVPCLDVKDGRVVKGIQFVNLIDAGDPVENAVNYEKNGADEIVFLDITASSDKRAILLDTVKKVAEKLFIPFCVGGGINSVKDMQVLLKYGADKVSINTAAFNKPELITEASEQFGSQCIVAAIDAKYNGDFYEVYLHGGRTPTKKDAIEWAYEVEKRGAGEILLTSMDRDGTRNGFELNLLQKVQEVVSIPIIISGGVGKKEHFLEAFRQRASAALAASVFHFNQIGIRDLKLWLKENGIDIRI